MTIPKAEPQEQDRAPDSWEDCIRLLLDLSGENVIYRGQPKYDWPLWSSIERKLFRYAKEQDLRKSELIGGMSADPATELWARNVENALLQRFREQAVRFGIPNLPEAWDILGWWEVMQHHGAPTRLMDWTSSPFVAAWFALYDHKDGDGDMGLWAYDRSISDKFFIEAAESLRSAGDYLEIDDRQYQNRLLKLALETKDRVLIPVRPRQFPRAVAQHSVLTVSSAIGAGHPENLPARGKATTHIRLKESWKSQIKSTCRTMGFSEVSMFRDLDSLGASIAQLFEDGLKLFNPYAP